MYTALGELHREFGDNINILLYPSDEFGGQELPSKDVPAFVKGKGLPTDGGGCHLMQKVKTNGPQTDAAWKLAKAAFGGDIGWNFDGIFLFDAAGTPVGRYKPEHFEGAGGLVVRGEIFVKLVGLVAASEKQEL